MMKMMMIIDDDDLQPTDAAAGVSGRVTQVSTR
jgi:hypothetical protein